MAPGALLQRDFELLQQYKVETKKSVLHHGWPAHLDSKSTWHGSQFSVEDYTYHLTIQDQDEIDAALSHFQDLGLDTDGVTRDTFPIPILGAKLSEFSVDLYQGKGFFNIRGLDPRKYSAEDNVLVFLGISSYVAEQRAKQDSYGYMLTHIRDDKTAKEKQQSLPIRYSKMAATFHTDPCDILALQTRSCAAKGGNHQLASSSHIYNELIAKRPDVVELLKKNDWGFDTRGRLVSPNSRSLLYSQAGRIILDFDRQALETQKDIVRSPGLPYLSPKQLEALKVVEKIAQQSKLTIKLQRGDFIFVNNHALLHTRENFEDDDENSRYLVRMWLRNKEMAWELPLPIKQAIDGFYREDEYMQIWNILPVPKVQYEIPDRLST